MDDAIAWGGISLCPGAGGPARYLQLHLHQEDSVMVGEDLVYSLFATPLIVFGALSGLRKWCQRRLISGPCSYYWRRRIQYTSRLVFAFFDSIIGGVFLSI